ncbi:MAG: hypothetical protein MJ016_05825 [Victivallaceae bacterium]|nr:hypothetical protein [Victivallaceae bacterium]
MTSLFSPNPVNTGRQTELDVLKAVTIFEMIFMHLQEIVFSCAYNDRLFIHDSWRMLFFDNAFYLVGPFGFLFSMGCTIPFSRNNLPVQQMRRGVNLFVAWILLNALRMIPFAMLLQSSTGVPFQENYCRFVWANDVLFFAGAFFLFSGILQTMKASFAKIALFFAALFLVAQCAGDFGRFLPPGAHPFLAGFVEISPLSSFPLFNWGIVVALGVLWGKLLQRTSDKTKLYAWTGAVGIAAVAILLGALYFSGALKCEILAASVSNPLGVHQLGFVSLAGAFAVLSFLLPLFYFLSLALPDAVKKGISCVAGKILPIYFAHWLVLPWLGFIPWMRNTRARAGKIVFAALALYVVSFLLAMFYDRMKKTLKPFRSKEE